VKGIICVQFDGFYMDAESCVQVDSERGAVEFELPDSLGVEEIYLTEPVVRSFEQDMERLGCDFETAVVESLLLERAQECVSNASDSLGVEQSEYLDEAVTCVDNIEYRDTTVVEGFIDSIRSRDFY
jgi:hypothetical protein